MIRVEVTLGDRSYPVVIGRDARSQLAPLLPDNTRRVAVVTQSGIPVDLDLAVPSETFVIGDGEAAKQLSTVEHLTRGFARIGLSRADCVVAVGGGLVTDVAGFAAAVYHRGVPVVHVATTLLAQVDAAIGGKTGVNLVEGKNLVGAFWQPRAVVCDTATLDSLPEREHLSGRGEMAKYHFIGSQVGVETADMLQLPVEERVARCVEIKARYVAADEREGGVRAVLNYGHTLAHALEIAGDFDLRHGEAVSVGIMFAARLARRLGRIDQDRVDEHRRVLDSYSLPTEMPPGLSPERLIELMQRDKKALDGLTFVLDGPAGVESVKVPRTEVQAALHD